MNAIENGWVSPEYRNDENAAEFAEFLAANCVWSLDDFGGNYPWEASIPAREDWQREIDGLNNSLERQR